MPDSFRIDNQLWTTSTHTVQNHGQVDDNAEHEDDRSQRPDFGRKTTLQVGVRRIQLESMKERHNDPSSKADHEWVGKGSHYKREPVHIGVARQSDVTNP